MITRFEGSHGKKLLVDSLKRQRIVEGDERIAAQIAEDSTLIHLKPSEILINQGGTDIDVFFILAGRLSIQVNKREIAVRVATEHVGEMSLIDPSGPRSATVIALEESVVAQLGEKDFSKLAAKNPLMWRRAAIELCERLRQRNQFVNAPNPRPVLFIGSSSESLKIAREIQSGLRHDDVIVRVWTDKVFGASRYPLEDLEQQLFSSDFCVLVFGSDDIVSSRGIDKGAPRDNVVFELGLFMGALGRRRTYLVKPEGLDLKIPSDLLGLTPLSYRRGADSDLPSLIAPICDDLRTVIKKMGPK